MWYVMQVYTGQEEKVCGQCRSRVMEKDEDVFVFLAQRMTKIQGEWTLITRSEERRVGKECRL